MFLSASGVVDDLRIRMPEHTRSDCPLGFIHQEVPELDPRGDVRRQAMAKRSWQAYLDPFSRKQALLAGTAWLPTGGRSVRTY